MIKIDLVTIRDAWGRPAYTGTFERTWMLVRGTGCWVLAACKRVA